MAGGFDFSIDGLITQVQSVVKPTGVYASNPRDITPNIGNTVVGATVNTNLSFWDRLGNVGSAILDNQMVQRYVDGKITKELMNDGVPLYTTYGNPSDQAGGKLLQDVAVAEQNATRMYMLVGLGLAGLLGIGLIIASSRK